MARPRKIAGTKLTGGVVRSKRAAPPVFDLCLPDLEAELRCLLAQIPAGRVCTYGGLADALGLRAAARWVGEFLREHDHGPACPCHRVVRKDGALGLYLRDRNPSEKAAHLRREGVNVADGLIERFLELVFCDFQSTRPLARLVELQHAIARHVRIEPFAPATNLAAGLDVSYARGGAAVGACAVCQTDTGRLVWSTTRRFPAPLPYIPSLLTYRELPVLLSLFEEARHEFPELNLFLVDGNGILHPRGAGVATCFGVVADVPTVGVAKSLLCGRVEADLPAIDGCRPITVEGTIVGAEFKRSRDAHRLYISPGQRMELDMAILIARMFDLGHRLPEPLFWADRLSRAEARRAVDDSLL